MRAQRANTIGWWRFTLSDINLHVFGIECCKPDFVLMLGFYHNFSISPKKILRKIFGMLLKTQRIFIIEHYLHSHYWTKQRIFIIEHYLHSHYWTKMSDTFTFNRTELLPICQNKPWNFYTNFSITGLFPLGCSTHEDRT